MTHLGDRRTPGSDPLLLPISCNVFKIGYLAAGVDIAAFQRIYLTMNVL